MADHQSVIDGTDICDIGRQYCKTGTDGIPQMLFYLGGTALWTYFSSCLTGNSTSFTSNAHLFGKVYFPRMVMPISQVIGSVIRFGIQMIPVALLMIFYLFKGAIYPHFELWILLPFLLLWLGILGMGFGILISGMTTKYRDLSVLVSFGMQILMYGTPVVYPLTTLCIEIQPVGNHRFWNTHAFGHIRFEGMYGEIVK